LVCLASAKICGTNSAARLFTVVPRAQATSGEAEVVEATSRRSKSGRSAIPADAAPAALTVYC